MFNSSHNNSRSTGSGQNTNNPDNRKKNIFLNALTFVPHRTESNWTIAQIEINKDFSLSIVKREADRFFCAFLLPNGDIEEISDNMSADDTEMLLNSYFADEVDESKPLKVNDILYSSWGYEQTNVSFYQVIKATPKTVTVRKIKSLSLENHAYMSGVKYPIINQFRQDKKTIRRKVIDNSSVRINDCEFAHKWNGKSKNFSSYA